MTTTWTVVRAAAGCGKTTDLACQYLAFLAEGVPAEQAIAITFTRKAAAELEERVSLSLRACLGGPGADEARDRLGAAWPRYRDAAPRDPVALRAALAAMPEAPIGTTDAFVQQLLTEFALDAALPLPSTHARAPLDLPIHPGAGVARALERSARRVLDPPIPGDALDPDVALLTRYRTLDQLLVELARRTDHDHLALATSVDVLGAAARWMAEVLAQLDLRTIYGAAPPHDEPAWREALERHTNKSGQWAIPRVAAWLASGAEPEQAPYALCGWLQGLQNRGARRQVRDALIAQVRSFGPAELSLWQVVHALRYPYDDDAQVRLADDLRAARWRLRQRVLSAGLEWAALAGELGYDELIEAAIGLCEAPPARLRDRFQALLVDEIQDADPRQLRLFRALGRLGAVRTYFVGDPRQSIYLFRGAEPDGLRQLEQEAAATAGEVRDLWVNRRSAPRLVEAQRSLFGALDPAMRQHRWRPLLELTGLGSDPANQDLALDATLHDPDAPVVIAVPTERGRVTGPDLDDRALATFLGRVARARAEPGRSGDTAAVLAPTWAIAERACRRIREWSERADAAYVEGSASQQTGRVLDDLRLWLRALLDRHDDAAWVGVWKHPSVGLSDAALARLVAGVGTATEDGSESPGWWRRLGFVVEAAGLTEPHDEADRMAFARARGPIARAVARMGRASTAVVLEPLVAALGWRTVLAAGPGGADELAELEVMLDWIRDQDADGRSADAILALLSDDARVDRPHVHVDRPPGHVACTTVFQAKGLAWDHVCVLRPGQHSRLQPTRDHHDGWMSLDGRELRLEGLEFDPRGGLLPFHDPLGRLAAKIFAVRYTEEAARLAYVAITRARRSVTMALSGAPAPGRREEPYLSEVMAKVWLDRDLPGVARIDVPAPLAPPPPPSGWVVPIGDGGLPKVTSQARTWAERAPYNLGAHLDAEVRQRHAEAVVDRIRLANGLHLGSTSVAPPGTDPVTGLGLPGHRLGQLQPFDWGNLAHGWFAEWRFQGDADPDAVDRYLAAEWGGSDPDVVTWIVALCDQLARVGGPVWQWVTDPGAKLHFEHPLLGLGWQRDQEVILSGRMDLAIEHGGGRMSVVDFKAGARTPTGYAELIEDASLRTYAFQLHAYADALARAGRRVDAVALWFVRTGTSVRWSP